MSERHPLQTGELTVDQMRAILDSIPADCTFSDADNIVRFYTERHRIFRRTPSVIGSDVIECHSPASRPRVAQLISELASGWRDEAVFTAEKDDRPIHIRYLPVRDAEGNYMGVFEIAPWADQF